jgi:hypothetical protein
LFIGGSCYLLFGSYKLIRIDVELEILAQPMMQKDEALPFDKNKYTIYGFIRFSVMNWA